jgi:hypothetical protein
MLADIFSNRIEFHPLNSNELGGLLLLLSVYMTVRSQAAAPPQGAAGLRGRDGRRARGEPLVHDDRSVVRGRRAGHLQLGRRGAVGADKNQSFICSVEGVSDSCEDHAACRSLIAAFFLLLLLLLMIVCLLPNLLVAAVVWSGC